MRCCDMEHAHARLRRELLGRDARSLVAAIKACSKLAAKEQSCELVNGTIVKLLSLERAISMYAKCGSLVDARSVFDRLVHPRLVSWTALLLAYCDHGDADAVMDLFQGMQAQGYEPNSRTFLAVLKACAKAAAGESRKVVVLERIMAVHARALECLRELDIQLANTLVDSYAKSGSIEDSRRVFNSMEAHTVVSWTVLMLGYVENGEETMALGLLSLAQDTDAQMFVVAVKACTSLALKEIYKRVQGKLVKPESLERGMAVHSRATELGYDSNSYLMSALVDMYAKCGSMIDSRRLFDRIPKPGVILWTALILGYAETREAQEAVELFSCMKVRGCQPNAQTYVAVLKAAAGAGSIKAGAAVHAEVCRQGLEDEAVTANSLVDLYAKCGRMAASQHLFDILPERTLVSWNTLIAGYRLQGDTPLVFDSFRRMQDEEVQPDAITFVSLLSACSHAGLVHRGRQLFAAMISSFGVTPSSEHYSCMADLFGRADQVDEAIAMAKAGTSSTAWLAVLAACCKLKDVSSGKAAFQSLLETGEGDGAAAYDLMANIFGSNNQTRHAL